MVRKQESYLTIGRAARAAGIATTTLRYYERKGILKPTARTDKGYRLYAGESLQGLAFIRSAQAVGFSLDDIRALLQLDADTSCGSVQRVIERRLADVDRRLSALKRVQSTLTSALRRCRQSENGCATLNDLRQRCLCDP